MSLEMKVGEKLEIIGARRRERSKMPTTSVGESFARRKISRWRRHPTESREKADEKWRDDCEFIIQPFSYTMNFLYHLSC